MRKIHFELAGQDGGRSKIFNAQKLQTCKSYVSCYTYLSITKVFTKYQFVIKM